MRLELRQPLCSPSKEALSCPTLNAEIFWQVPRHWQPLATAAILSTKKAEAGDPSFMNNVPDKLLSGNELPTFKFALEKSTGKVIGNSYGKEATVLQLPISKGIAGVSMRLEPGAMRELHWHATAAEWAFVIEGGVRTTVIDPQGYAETNDFEPGDLWYFPRGHGHMLECLGDQPTPFHPDLRQRLLFGVRHVQHQRLDRPYATRRCWPRISACPRRHSTDFRRRKSTSPAAKNRLKSRRSRCRVGSCRRRRTNIACWPNRRTASSREAASGGSTLRDSKSRRP